MSDSFSVRGGKNARHGRKGITQSRRNDCIRDAARATIEHLERRQLLTAALAAPAAANGWEAQYYISDQANQIVYEGDQMANVAENQPDGTFDGTVPSYPAAPPTNNAVLGFERLESNPINYTGLADGNPPPGAPAGFNSIEPAGPGHDIAARYTGYVTPTVTGYYTLMPRSDDGVAVTVFDTTNLTNGKPTPVTLKTDNLFVPRGPTTDNDPVVDSLGAPVQWVAGQKYLVQMDYNNQGGGWEADLSFAASSTPGGATFDALPTQLIPITDVSAPVPQFQTVDAANPGGLAKDNGFYALTATSAVGAIQLQFNNIDASSYNVYRSATPIASNSPSAWGTAIGSVAANTGGTVSYVDSTGTNGTTYYYLVTGVNASGEGNGIQTSATPGATLAAPSNLTAATAPTTATDVNLNFTIPANAQSIIVSRSTDGTTFTPIATISPAPAGPGTYQDTSIDAFGGKFYYQVQAANFNGTSAPSNTASVNIVSPSTSFTDNYSTDTSKNYTETQQTPPPAMVDSWAVNTNNKTLEYSVQTNTAYNTSVFLLNPNVADSVGLYKFTTSGDINAPATFQAGLVLSGDTTHGGFVVQEYNAGNLVNHLVLLRETGPQLTGDEGGAGTPPVLADFGSIALNNTDSFHIVGTIDRSGPPVITVTITDLTNPSFTIPTQTVTDSGDPSGYGGTQIGWRARFSDTTTAFSVTNLSLQNTLPATDHAPAAPSGLAAAQGANTSVNLTWTNNADNGLDVVVERSSDGINFTPINSVPGTATTYNDPTVQGGLTYSYRVRAFNGFAGGTYSAPSNVATIGVNSRIVNFLDNYKTDTSANYTTTDQDATELSLWTVNTTAGTVDYSRTGSDTWASSVFLLNPNIANTAGLSQFTTSGDFLGNTSTTPLTNGNYYQPGLVVSGDPVNGGFVVAEYENGPFQGHIVLLRETGGQLVGDEGGTGNPPVLADFGTMKFADTYHVSAMVNRSGAHPVITVSITDTTTNTPLVTNQVVTDGADPATYGGTQIGWRTRYEDNTATPSFTNLSLQSVSSAAIHLTTTSFNDGVGTANQAQRSEVRKIVLAFSSAIQLGAGALTLTSYTGNDTTGTFADGSAALGTPTTTDGGLTWTIPILANTAFSDATGSLKDGIYKVTVDPTKVTGGTLAGNNLSTTFHRLYGDIDGNKTVNSADYFKFKAAFGSTTGQPAFNADFDFDGNGKINSSDYFKFKANFGRKFTY